MSSSSIYVSIVQTGCRKAEFDSTYPIQLNGIIGQGEFVESIEKINHASFGRKAAIAIIIIYILSTIISMTFIIYGTTNEADSNAFGLPSLVAVGMGVSVVGTIVFIILADIIRLRRLRRMREVIAEESMKYSARSPTPCSWRLETTGVFEANGNLRAGSHLIIDIGRATTAPSGGYLNQGANESSYLTREYNQYPPPPYSGLSTVF